MISGFHPIVKSGLFSDFSQGGIIAYLLTFPDKLSVRSSRVKGLPELLRWDL